MNRSADRRERSHGAFLGALLVMVLAFNDSIACECPPPREASNFERADAVFVGVPSWIEDTMSIGGSRRINLKVTKVLKGKVGSVVRVETPATPAACGIFFEPYQPYLVFAEITHGALIVRACEGTKLMSHKQGRDESAREGTDANI